MKSRSSCASSLRNARIVTSLPSSRVTTDSGTSAGAGNVVILLFALTVVALIVWSRAVFLDVRMACTSYGLWVPSMVRLVCCFVTRINWNAGFPGDGDIVGSTCRPDDRSALRRRRKQLGGGARDHPFLVSRNHEHLNPRIVGADARNVARVTRVV